MNLVQLSNELEYLPKDKLAEMSQDPNSMYPPYLVLAEIQRRTQMEKMYAAAQPRPQTTVAEEVVNEFTMTNPNAGISSMTGSAPTDRFSPESKDIPAPVLMQTAASGGLTGYANGGFFENRYYGNDGKFKLGQAGLDAASVGLLFVPGVGLVRAGAGLAGAAYKGLKGFDFAKKAKQAGQATFTKPNPNIIKGEGFTMRGANEPLRVYSPRRGSAAALGGIGGLQAINYAMQDDEKVDNQTPPPERELTAEEKELMRLQNEAAMAETKPKRKGLDDSALDLVGLGGLIMGARNVSELGKGISDFATAKQVARGDKAQQDYYAASAAKAQEEVANMPLDRVLTSIDSLTKQQKQFLDGGDMESATAIGLQLQLLNQRALELQGIDLKTQASMDKNLIASFGT